MTLRTSGRCSVANVRRHTKQRAIDPDTDAPRVARHVIAAAPAPTPAIPPCPHGNLDTATPTQISDLTDLI